MASKLGIAGLVMAAYLGIFGSQLSAKVIDNPDQHRVLPRSPSQAYYQRHNPWSRLQDYLRQTGEDYTIVRAPEDNMPIIVPNLERYGSPKDVIVPDMERFGSPKDVIVPDLRRYNMPIIRPREHYKKLLMHPTSAR